MKALIFILISLMFVGCVACVKKPTPMLDKKTKEYVEPISCFYYRECMYYNVVDKKGRESCKAEFMKCSKDLDFRHCREKENLPEGVNFNSCFDKLQ